MPTRTGFAVLVGGAGIALAGRALGLVELIVIGTGLVLLSLGAVVLVRILAPQLSIARSVHPSRVTAGSASRVELVVTNDARRASPVAAVLDDVSGTAGARLLIGPVAPGAEATAAYRLPTGHRGIVDIGPLRIETTDPFGLASRVRVVGLDTELTVLPRIVRLLPLPFSLGNDPLAGAEAPNNLGRGGEDFSALRPYVIGDDMRRVHWPSSARAGELVVRQDEQPWQGRVTVVLDSRRAGADADRFEDMVSAAASIVTASRHRGDLVRLISTGGLDTGFLSGHAQLDALMEHLAVIERSSTGTLIDSLGTISKGAGTIVAVIGDIPQPDLDAIVAARPHASGLAIVHLSGPVTAATASLVLKPGPGSRIRVVRVAEGRHLREEWNRVMGRGRAGVGVR